ncbi:MAG: T9SS type A sorting domain-containing protein [Bacteroidetes bacterium]|nr:T9SS type A sorting domain-containing protein [Bacteroidota bacterium]
MNRIRLHSGLAVTTAIENFCPPPTPRVVAIKSFGGGKIATTDYLWEHRAVSLDCSLYQLELTASHPSGMTQYFNWSNGVSGQRDTIYAGGPYRLWYTDPYGCVSYTTVSVPYAPESYFDWFPTGCYDVCYEQLPLTMYGPPDVFAAWSWMHNGGPVSSGTHSVMAPLSITGAGTYSATLDNGLCSDTTDKLNVNVVSCDNCPPLILNGNAVCDPSVPGGYIVNLTLNVTFPNTNCTIGTGIGPTVPFSAFFSTPGAYPLTLNFTTLSIPPPATATIMVRYFVTNHGVTQECYDTLQLSLPDCTGQWPPQRQTQNGPLTGSADGMMVYPNPASHTVGVSYNFGTTSIGENSRRIVVYDMMGRPVYTARVSDAIGNLSIPVDWMAAAVYIVRMEKNGRTVHAQRLTITH